jgi:protein SCO1/2
MRLRGAFALVLIWSILLPLRTPLAKERAAVRSALGEVGIDEKLGAHIPLDLGFVGADSDSVYLRDVIDKPTVLTLVYYHCQGICLPLLTGLADVVSKTDLKPGEDYDILTVSFDPSDNPVTSRGIRDNVTAPFKGTLPKGAWRFLTGDSVSIAAITGATGFKYKRVQKDFVHGTALIVLSPDGKIVRYLYGLSYLPFDLKMAVAEASEGKVVPSVTRVLRFCFSYDPEGKKYVLNMTRVVGSLVVFGALVFVLGLVILERKKKRAPV